MTDIKLFNINGDIRQYQSSTVTLERDLQVVIERNMSTFFGVRFLASEYSTTDGGRMDSIGIDENNCPVIFEYKRLTNENVINQWLFYLNWLMDHNDSFKVLVIERLGIMAAEQIDWSMPRVVCIAGDFTKYDESAIKQMNRNISLLSYKKFGSDLLMFEQLNENVVHPIAEFLPDRTQRTGTDKTFDEKLNGADDVVRAQYADLCDYMHHLGDDVYENKLKLYVAFKKIRNFASVVMYKSRFLLYLHLDPTTVTYESGFSRDVSAIGHWGTGFVELNIKSAADFEKARPLIDRAYNEN